MSVSKARLSRVATLLSLVPFSMACVPATAELDPRGAGGVVVEPSAPTRGEPFVTSDGWTVTFGTFAFRAVLFASAETEDGSRFSETDEQIWGSTRAEMFVPAVRVGPCHVNLLLSSAYVGPPGSDAASSAADSRRGPGVELSIVERFLRLADNSRPNWSGEEAGFGRGPTVVFALRAEKAGKTYVLDLALQSDEGNDWRAGPTIDVRANDVVFAPWSVRAERVLEVKPGVTSFSDLAEADDKGDHDGRITAAELLAIDIGWESCADDVDDPISTSSHEPCSKLIDRLAARASTILAEPRGR